MKQPQKQLRFAALRRVSTEQQEKTGESLRTQTRDITERVKELGGVIVEWYGGQEHATPGHEKKEVSRLLHDAQKSRFGAVIVAHPDRWSRDNNASRQGLEIFREHGIRFFAGATEYDLFNPDHEMFLGISAVIGQFQARNQALKSMRSRINKAKRGIPTGGKVPFGRIWVGSKDGQTGHWEVDPEKKRMVQDCAKRYLAGESIENLAREYGVNAPNLHKVLTKRSGTKWEVEFKSDTFRIHEVVPIEVPALLDEKTIRAIRAKMAVNKTYHHGKRKHHYLFASLIRCAHCGYIIIGQTNHNGHRYYRHLSEKKRVNPCPGPERKAWVVADKIEDMVLRHLFETFGNPSAVSKAIKEATPKDQQVQEALAAKEQVNKALTRSQAALQRLVRAIAQGTIGEQDAKKEVGAIKEKIAAQEAKLAQIDRQLEHIPDAKKVREASERIAKQFGKYLTPTQWAKRGHANRAFEEMTYAERRRLCELVFSGTTREGKRMGVTISWSDGGKKWKYRVEGHFIEVEGRVLTDSQKDAVFVFGAPTHQKALVTKSAPYSPGKAPPAPCFASPASPPDA